MDSGLMIAFWGVSLTFVLTPGADWAYAITSGLRHRAIPAVSGMLTAHLAAAMAVALGVATLLAASDAAMTALTITGAAYLVWLGICSLRSKAALTADGSSTPPSEGRPYVKGIGVTLLNPKLFLLFIALLPQFIDRHAALPSGIQMMLLGILHVANCAAVYLAVSFGSGAVLTRRPRAAKVVSVLSGVVMIGLGIAIGVERLLALQ